MIPLLYPAFTFKAGESPLLISMPHPGLYLPLGFAEMLTPSARKLPDTDWHIPRLYDFAAVMGAGILEAHYSRFVIDLNRPPDDAKLYSTTTTGLFPEILFDGTPIFLPGKAPNAELREFYLQQIWHAYHRALNQALEAIKKRHGYAVLLDAHSIKSVVPLLFDGRLPDFNLGTNNGASCDEELRQLAFATCNQPGYRTVLDARFKGGYITRHYGRPEENIHAIQLELSQRTYMIEESPYSYDEALATRIRPILARLVGNLIAWRPKNP